MKRSALYENHKRRGARFIEFAGWEAPLSFSGTTEEHQATRTAGGLFDVTHLGRIEVRGRKATEVLQRTLTVDVTKLSDGAIRYTLLCNREGGILDDLVVYRRKAYYLLCVNAATCEKDLRWIVEQGAGRDVTFTETTEETVMIALQGPHWWEVFSPLLPQGAEMTRRWHARDMRVSGADALVSRTGYTGEDGCEIILPADRAAGVWEALLEKGEQRGIKPCGLGARDTLRLEMGYMLYGQDMDETTTPLEADLLWVVDLEKGDFVGRDAILTRKKQGLTRQIVGFELLQRGVPRKGYKIYSDGKEIGVVTSGNISPMSGKGIGMGYVQIQYARVGGEIFIDIRGKAQPAVIVKRPFYLKPL